MKGKIYIIRSHLTDDVYYGSTTQKYLSSRFGSHKFHYKKWINEIYTYTSSFEIIKYGDAYIELVEEVEYETKEQLKAREGHYIRNNNCVNKVIPNRTQKEWYEVNKEKIKEQQKEYQEKNKDKIKEYQEKNRDKINEYKKEYYEKNKDKINTKRKELYDDNKELQKEYRDKNRDKINQRQREYRNKNRDKNNQRQREYRKRIKNAEV